MKTRVQKWGNSLALRIPKSFAIEIGLQSESAVEVSMEDGKLVIAPVAKPEFNLRQLLAKVTPENVQHEIETGPVTGNEVW
jgi:antitoxin MazE